MHCINDKTKNGKLSQIYCPCLIFEDSETVSIFNQIKLISLLEYKNQAENLIWLKETVKSSETQIFCFNLFTLKHKQNKSFKPNLKESLFFLDAIASVGLQRILTDSPCRMFISEWSLVMTHYPPGDNSIYL